MVACVFDIMQDRPAALALLVKPIHHDGLLVVLHMVVRLKFGQCERFVALQLPLEVRVLRFQGRVVHLLNVEKMRGFLDICQSRLPEQIEDRHLLHRHVAQAVELRAIPEHAIHRCA